MSLILSVCPCLPVLIAGLIRFLGPPPPSWKALTNITADAQHTTRVLRVASSSRLHAGMWVTIGQGDDPMLFANVNAKPACAKAGNCMLPGPGSVLRFHSRIESVTADGVVMLERHLPFNVSARSHPVVYPFVGAMQDVGVQGLTMEMR